MPKSSIRFLLIIYLFALVTACGGPEDQTKYIYGIKNEFRFDNFQVDTQNQLVSIEIFNPSTYDSGFVAELTLMFGDKSPRSYLRHYGPIDLLEQGMNTLSIQFANFQPSASETERTAKWEILMTDTPDIISIRLWNTTLKYRGHADSSLFQDPDIISLHTSGKSPNYQGMDNTDSLYTPFPIIEDKTKIYKTTGWISEW